MLFDYSLVVLTYPDVRACYVHSYTSNAYDYSLVAKDNVSYGFGFLFEVHKSNMDDSIKSYHNDCIISFQMQDAKKENTF